jgi:ArsR family transcriptional regulator
VSCSCKSYARLFDALSNPNRLHILNTLIKGPKKVGEIIEQTGMEQTAVSHGLRQLEQARFVTAKREGKFRIYTLAAPLEPLLSLIDRHIGGKR